MSLNYILCISRKMVIFWCERGRVIDELKFYVVRHSFTLACFLKISFLNRFICGVIFTNVIDQICLFVKWLRIVLVWFSKRKREKECENGRDYELKTSLLCVLHSTSVLYFSTFLDYGWTGCFAFLTLDVKRDGSNASLCVCVYVCLSKAP